MVRGRDACWEHCVLVDAAKQKVRCNYCQKEFSGGVYRMKFHLAQMKNKDIVPCTEVPTDVRDHILVVVSTPKKEKPPKKRKLEKAAPANDQRDSSSASGDYQLNHGSTGQNGSTCPSPLVLHASPTSQKPVEDVQKKRQDLADKKVSVFFFHNSIPFSAAKSVYYREMVDAVAECGEDYKTPSYEVLRSTLLEKVKDDINDFYKKYREEWKETGCTILCDSWSDDRNESLIIFSVTCSKGTFFLKSIDLSGHEDDSNYLFELLESVVLEVGVENVVQIITDTSLSYVYAGRLLMDKYSTLFWSPCASYCINKMLEDIGKQKWVCTVLEEARTITSFIYSRAWTLSMTRNFTGGMELIKPKITRYVTNFLNLRSIVIQEENLKHMFSHTEWLSSPLSRIPEARAVKSLLYLERFWKHAQEAVTIVEPLVKILRMVDGDMPAMGYIHEGIECAKHAIKTHYKDIEEKYIVIWDIIDRRWTMQLQSSLHAAAASLNPSLFYNPIFKIDLRMRNGFQETMLRMVTTHEEKMEISKEHPVFLTAQGALGTDFAIMGRILNAPGDWWAAYGYEIPTLQRYAVRILSQPCSSHWCCWNFKTFLKIHTKKRRTEELLKFNDLVFVHCNLWLQSLCQSRKGKRKPIVFDEIDVSSEWPTELESPAPLLDDSLLDSLPLNEEAVIL